jgi:hypothetical protein
MAIFLYADCVIAAGVVLCASYAITIVKGFADACYKDKESIAEGVMCCKNREDKRRHKEVITSPIRVKLRQS